MFLHCLTARLLVMPPAVRPSDNKPPSSSEKRSLTGNGLREARIRKGLTQIEVAERAGIHRNTIRNLENGNTRQVKREHAAALSRIFGATPVELGLQVRRPAPPLSVRIRQLTPEQRELVNELLSLPPKDFDEIREAVAALRKPEQLKAKGRKR